MKIVPNLKLTLSEIACALGATIPTYDFPIGAIVTNSQESRAGDLFIALNGKNTSGELFTESARKNGAFILSSRDKFADFKVSDTEQALLNIAAYYKSKLKNLKHY